MKRFIARLAVLAIIVAAAAACSGSGHKNKKQEDMTNNTNVLPEEPVFDIVTDLGTIRIRLYKETPKHRDNFAKLASEGFYEGILFHRVINGFMIQAGDPLTKDPSKASLYGTGDPGYRIPAEFNPALTHKKGALAAARRGDAANPKRESSGSQFYIVQDEDGCRPLDGQYTVFGETIEGLDVIDRIAAVPTDRMDRPVEDIRIKEVRLILPEGWEAPVAPKDTTAAPADTTPAPKDTTDAE